MWRFDFASRCPSTWLRAGVLAAAGGGSNAVDVRDNKVEVTVRADAIIQIKEGDNLYNLAKEHNVTVEQLVKWNDIKDPSKMSAGNYLKVNETSRTETFEKEDESVEIISNENE